MLGAFRSMTDGSGAPAAEVLLSPRELEVLDCLVMGNSNKEIGDALFITEQTVKNHMPSVLKKLQVDDRVAALPYAVTKRWAEIGLSRTLWSSRPSRPRGPRRRRRRSPRPPDSRGHRTSSAGPRRPTPTIGRVAPILLRQPHNAKSPRP